MIGRLLKMMSEGNDFKVRPETLKGMESLEGGADAVSQLNKNYTLTPLEDGSLFAEARATDSVINQLETEVGHLALVADDHANYAAKHINGEIAGAESPIAKQLNVSGVISGVTIPQQMLKNWQKTQDVAGVINTRLMPREFDLLPTVTDWGGKRIKTPLWHIISNPKHAFAELAKDLVVKPTDLKLTADKYGKHARATWKRINKGLSNKEKENFNSILEKGNDAEEVFEITPGGLIDKKGNVYEASEKVVESYYASRMLLDHMYWLNNTSAVRQARSKNFKLMKTADDNDILVRDVKGRHGESYSVFRPNKTGESKFIKWSKDVEEEGFKVIEFVSKEGKQVKLAMSNAHHSDLVKDIHNTYDMIGYRKGYVPVLYKDNWAVNKLVKMKDGTYRASRVAAAPTRVKANKAVQRMQQTHKLEAEEAEHLYIASRKNDTSTDVAYGENLHSIVDNMSGSEVQALKKALVNMGLDPEIADTLEGTARFFSHKRNPFMQKRGLRLQDWQGQNTADILPADAAIQKYLQASSSYAANADYVGKLEQRFLGEFGELLTSKTDYRSPLRNDISHSTNGRTVFEANAVRGQINRIAGIANPMDRTIDNYILAVLDRFAETGIGRTVNKVLDQMSDMWGMNRLVSGTPSLTIGVAKIKGFTATAKLGLWNMSQAVVQGTAALNVIGKNPILATRGSMDVMQAIAPEIMKVGRTVEGRKLYDAIDRSGFIAGFDYVELQRVAAKGTDKILGSRALRKVVDTNLIPYHLGEGGVRALAWFTERRGLIREIQKGLSDLKMADVDSTVFLSRINERASITALNMSRVNQPLISRGFWGVPFQFKQFLIQQGEFMFNRKNFGSLREMAGVWGAWVGAFGIQGVPWLFDVMLMVEQGGHGLHAIGEKLGIDVASPETVGRIRKTGQETAMAMSKQLADSTTGKLITEAVGKEKYNEAISFWNRFFQAGTLAALSDGELNVANRASLSRVFTEYYGNQSVYDTLFGPGYQTAKMLIHNNIDNLHDLTEVWRNGDEFTPGYMLGAGARGTKGLPGLMNPMLAARSYLTDEWRDTEMKLIEREPSLEQILLLGAGFSPAQRGERFERLEFTKRQKEAWKEWTKSRIDRIARMSAAGNVNYAEALLDDSLDQIRQSNPALGKEFMKAYSFEMMRRGMSEDDKEVLYRTQDSFWLDSEYDKHFFNVDTYIGWGDDE